jgi:thiol-disulfide isomerase/thioredoxin
MRYPVRALICRTRVRNLRPIRTTNTGHTCEMGQANCHSYLGRAFIALLMALLVAGCSKSENAVGNNGVNPKPYVVAPIDRRPEAPALVGKSLSGAPLTLASLRGRVVVLNFWAAWCGPCRAESAVLATVSAATAQQGISFVGVDEKDSRSAATTFTHARGISYPSAFDPNGTLAASWPGASGLPYTFVVDRHGKIATSVIGGVTEEELRAAVRAIGAEA